MGDSLSYLDNLLFIMNDGSRLTYTEFDCAALIAQCYKPI